MLKPSLSMSYVILDPMPIIQQKPTLLEMGRSFGTQKKKHQKVCEKETSGACTHAMKQKAEQENLNPAISDHSKREINIMESGQGH